VAFIPLPIGDINDPTERRAERMILFATFPHESRYLFLVNTNFNGQERRRNQIAVIDAVPGKTHHHIRPKEIWNG
jgi:hypothetical protein